MRNLQLVEDGGLLFQASEQLQHQKKKKKKKKKEQLMALMLHTHQVTAPHRDILTHPSLKLLVPPTLFLVCQVIKPAEGKAALVIIGG